MRGAKTRYTADHPRTVTMRRMWAEGKPIREIAEQVGISPSTAATFIHRHRDLFPNRFVHVSPQEVHRMWELYGNGLSLNGIAKVVRRSPGAVRRIIEGE